MPHIAGISIKQFLDIKDFSSGLLIDSKFHGEDEDMAPNHAEPLNKVTIFRANRTVMRGSLILDCLEVKTHLHRFIMCRKPLLSSTQ